MRPWLFGVWCPSMDVEIFNLCDFAKVYGGVLSLSNPFDTITAPKAPAVHPSCVLAMRIRFTKTEEGTKSFELRIIDQDGKDIAPRLAGDLRVKIPDGRISGANSIAFPIQGLTFPHFGEYSIRLAIDKLEVKSIPVFLIRTPTSPSDTGEGTEEQEGRGESE